MGVTTVTDGAGDGKDDVAAAPCVSICVPTYDGERYLQACLDGIAAQTFADVEVLIVDDGSSDRSVAIARAFAASHPRARVEINARNLGLVGNWDRCVALARGRWIKFVFQDDLIDPQCIEALVAAGTAAGTGLAACARTLRFEDGTSPSLIRWHAKHDAVLGAVYAAQPTLDAPAYCRARLRHARINLVGEPTVTLIRRDALARHGDFDAALVQMCDVEMWDRIACNDGVAYVARPLATFRVHGGSASGRNRGRQFRSGVLEDVVYLYALCHHPAFQRLRDVARGSGRGALLRSQLAAAVFEARDQLRWAGDAGGDGQALHRQFHEVMSTLPEIRPARARYLVHRIGRRFGLGATHRPAL